MSPDELLAEIQATFPKIEMPSRRELRFHSDGCSQCAYLSEYLDERRNQHVDGAMIRYMHQEMCCLSSKGWAWALPHYLPFCLTPEAEYNQMETEFLIYNLGPSEEHRDEQRIRLSALTRPQIRCLALFLDWLGMHPKWSEYCPEDIERALQFVRECDT